MHCCQVHHLFINLHGNQVRKSDADFRHQLEIQINNQLWALPILRLISFQVEDMFKKYCIRTSYINGEASRHLPGSGSIAAFRVARSHMDWKKHKGFPSSWCINSHGPLAARRIQIWIRFRHGIVHQRLQLLPQDLSRNQWTQFHPFYQQHQQPAPRQTHMGGQAGPVQFMKNHPMKESKVR